MASNKPKSTENSVDTLSIMEREAQENEDYSMYYEDYETDSSGFAYLDHLEG